MVNKDAGLKLGYSWKPVLQKMRVLIVWVSGLFYYFKNHIQITNLIQYNV